MTTLSQWLSSHKEISYRDRESILQHILNKKRFELYMSYHQILKPSQLRKCEKIAIRLKEGAPLEYLLGTAEFYGQCFQIEEGVFIPRAETEVLVSSVLDEYRGSSVSYFMDWGCGSGCIGLSLLLHFKQARLFAVDLSRKALDCVLKNAQNLGVVDRVVFIHASVEQLESKNFPPMDFITANPPYVAYDSDIDESVVRYEPHLALFSRDKGLAHISSWLHQAVRFLSNSSDTSLQNTACPSIKKYKNYFFEIGFHQYSKVFPLLRNSPQIQDFHYYLDEQGIERVIHCCMGCKEPSTKVKKRL